MNNVVVTGASGSIGRVIVDCLLKNGYTVYPLGKKEGKLNKYPNAMYGDLTDSDMRGKLYENLPSDIYALINCVGIIEFGYNSISHILETNVEAIYEFSKLLISKLNGGIIINITSSPVSVALPNMPGYLASKEALASITRSMALDYKLRANNISLGYIKTNMSLKTWKNEKKRKLIEEQTILGKWGEPEDVVGAVLFLISDQAKYITGIDLIIDGGWNAKGL